MVLCIKATWTLRLPMKRMKMPRLAPSFYHSIRLLINIFFCYVVLGFVLNLLFREDL